MALATLRRIILRVASCQVVSLRINHTCNWYLFQRNDNKGEPIERLATFKHITLHVWQQILVDAWFEEYRWCSHFSKFNVQSHNTPEIQISKNLAINLLFHFFLSYFGESSNLSTAGCEDGRSNKITDSKMQKTFSNGSKLLQIGAQQTVCYCTIAQLSLKQ